MSRNRIIPQMFDVRPVAADGSLDWRKIEALGKKKNIRQDKDDSGTFRTEIQAEIRKVPEAEAWKIPPRTRPSRAQRKTEVFVLGQKFESDSLPVFQPPHRPQDERSRRKSFSSREFYLTADQFLPATPKAVRHRRSKAFSALKFIIWPFEATKKTFRIILQILGKGILAAGKLLIGLVAGIIFLPIKSVTFAFSSVHNFVRHWGDRSRWFWSAVFPSRRELAFGVARQLTAFSLAALIVASSIGVASFWSRGNMIKGKVLGVSQDGFSNLNEALASLKAKDFGGSIANFDEASSRFEEASHQLDQVGSALIGVSKYVPFASQLASGNGAIEAGRYFSQAGEELAQTVQVIASFKGGPEGQKISFLDLFRQTKDHLRIADENLKAGSQSLEAVNIDDLPEDKKEKFLLVREMLPDVISGTESFLKNEEILEDLLGGNGPRKYLFLFQNNQEMRATGGFIGSYGFADVKNGELRNFFINGIFDPDGQLTDKIVPPLPIQKISAAWSLHDSNWFPDFPVSAEKAILFYEKTGGPTVDGVVSITPTVIEKLLRITGPVEMADYGVTLTADNFIRETQEEVEVNYDKEENKPKKILSDLAPVIIAKLFSDPDLKTATSTLGVLLEALDEKQILLYSRNDGLEKLIADRGWSGKILDTSKDYLSVINTNINGFKTDGVIEEDIQHAAEIQNDGSVIDTVTITRKHNGGRTGYEWWDKVNADYMRVYVPLGSELLEVEGQTRETVKAPLDYDALSFKRDPQVESEERGVRVDDSSGTRIYQDAGKTVFANWTYVSPQETMTIVYRYRLPFKISFSDPERQADSYSLLVQKQPGSFSDHLRSSLAFPRSHKLFWQSPESLPNGDNRLEWEAGLKTDQFWGATFIPSNLILN